MTARALFFLALFATMAAAHGPIEHESWFTSQRTQPTPQSPAPRDESALVHVVGDTMSFWALNMYAHPNPYFQLYPSTCRGVSDHAYVFVENGQWNVNITQQDVDTIMAHWDQHTLADPSHGVFYLDSAFFGAPPDVFDNDEHIYILYYDFYVWGDGYFGSYNQYLDTFVNYYWSPPGFWHSNEIEMIYMNTNSPSGGPSSPILLSVLAHEFEHLIHWNYDTDEESWVDEGCAEYAMVLYGYPDPVGSFTNNTDVNLTTWVSGFADYAKVLLFFTYLAEQYASPQVLPEIVHRAENSTVGVDSAFASLGYAGATVSSVLPDWSVATYLDDTTIASGRYGYRSLVVPTPFAAANVSSFPWNASLAVNAWAGEYVLFYNDTGAVDITFDGNDAATYHNRVLKIDLQHVYPTEVIETPLGAGNVWSGLIPGLSAPYERIVHVTARNSTSGASGYTMSSTLTGVPDDEGPRLPVALRIEAAPNPFNAATMISFDLPAAGHAELCVFDMLGRRAATLVVGNRSAGSHVVRWDADGLASGVYLVSLSSAGGSAVTRVVLLR